MIPKGWAWAHVGDVLAVRNGFAFKSSDYRDKGVPLIRQADLVGGIVDLSDTRYLPVEFLSRYSDFAITCGQMLIGMSGALGKISTYKGDIPALQNQRTGLLVPRADISSAFIKLILKFVEPQIVAEGRGIAVQNVSAKDIESCEFPLPPFGEQQRIADVCEEIFSTLDSAAAALRRVQANLKRYRTSVLKVACEGRLVPTEAELARKEGRTYETGEQLLKGILEERRANWETDQLAKMLAADKPPKNDGWKRKYKEPEAPDTSNLPELPEGWAWASIDQVAECLDSQRVPVNKEERARRGGNIPYYGANAQVGWIDDYLFDEPLVLVVEDETFVGRTSPFSYLIKGKSWVNNHAHILRATDAVLSEFLNYSLAYYPFTPLTTGSTGRRKLTQKALMYAPYALPPLAEQARIVAEIERRLSNVDEIAEGLGRSGSRADRLRRGILKRAFEGKLVPQDPNDEPASVLLQRIQASRQPAGVRTRTVPQRRTNAAVAAGEH